MRRLRAPSAVSRAGLLRLLAQQAGGQKPALCYGGDGWGYVVEATAETGPKVTPVAQSEPEQSANEVPDPPVAPSPQVPCAILDHAWCVTDYLQLAPPEEPCDFPEAAPICWPSSDVLNQSFDHGSARGLEQVLGRDWGGWGAARVALRGSVDLLQLVDRLAQVRSLDPAPEQRKRPRMAPSLWLDESLSMRPLNSFGTQLARRWQRASRITSVHRLNSMMTSEPPRGLHALLFSDLRNPVVRRWLTRAVRRGVKVLVVCPSRDCDVPRDVPFTALSALTRQDLVPATAELRQCLNHVFHCYPEALSAWAGNWYTGIGAQVLAWALWNDPTVAHSWTRCWPRHIEQQHMPIAAERLAALLAHHRDLHTNAAEPGAYPQIVLAAAQTLPEALAEQSAQARAWLQDLARIVANSAGSEQRRAALRLECSVAQLPAAERAKHAALYSRWYSMAEAALSLTENQGRVRPADLLPPAASTAGEPWRLAEIGNYIQLQREAELNEFQRSTLAFSRRMRLASGQMILVQIDNGAPQAFFAEHGLKLADTVQRSLLQLTTADEFLQLKRVERPNWAVGIGRDAQDAFVMAPNQGRAPIRLALSWSHRSSMKTTGDISVRDHNLAGLRALVVCEDPTLMKRLVRLCQTWGIRYHPATDTAVVLGAAKFLAGLGENWAYTVAMIHLGSSGATTLLRDLSMESELKSLKFVLIGGDRAVHSQWIDVRISALEKQFADADLKDVLERALRDSPINSASRPTRDVAAAPDAPSSIVTDVNTGASDHTLLDINPVRLNFSYSDLRELQINLIDEAKDLAREFSSPHLLHTNKDGQIGAHVLLVEDNPVNRHVAMRLLNLFGLTFETAENGKQALELLCRGVFDVVLMDCHMPVVDGYTATRSRRAIEQERGMPRIPIIGMTTTTMLGDRQILASGMDDCISKPLNRDLLKQTIYKWLQKGWRASIPEMLSPAATSAPTPNTDSVGKLSGHVLLAEDNQVNRKVAQRILNILGLSVEVAENGKQALDLLDHMTFDVVLMDCQMPKVDGYTATRMRRALEIKHKLKRIPIIAMIASAMTSDAERCMKIGMDDYLWKPLNRELLENTLRKWLPAGAQSRGRAAAAVTGTFSPQGLTAPPFPKGVALDREIVDDLREVMGEEFVELVTIYLEDAPKNLTMLLDAADRGDVRAMVSPAHTLKATSADVGAIVLADIARRIEHGARAGDLSDPQGISRSARIEFQRAAQEFRVLLAR